MSTNKIIKKHIEIYKKLDSNLLVCSKTILKEVISEMAKRLKHFINFKL